MFLKLNIFYTFALVFLTSNKNDYFTNHTFYIKKHLLTLALILIFIQKKTFWKIFFCICINLIIGKQGEAQNHQKSLDELYQKCTQTRIDSIHRLIIGFIRKYEISFRRKGKVIQTPEKFQNFCKNFKKICVKNNQKAILRRFAIIELTDNLKHQEATPQQAKQAFEKLLEELIASKDYSATLSCLLESALAFSPTQLDALKVLFFAEKFAEKHHLQKDIALQSVYQMMGFYLWELNIYTLSNQYFQKSLATKYALSADSLQALNGIGINYQKLQDFKMSNQYLEKASQYALKIKNNLFNTIIEGNKAVNFFKMGKLEKAYTLALKDKNTSLQHELWENAFGAMYWLTQIEIGRKNIEKAKFFVDSLEILKNKVIKEDSKLILNLRQKETIYLYQKATGNSNETLRAYQNYIKTDSTFQALAHNSKISEIQLKAEVDIYIQEIAKKEKEKEINSWFFGVIVIILLVLLFLLVNYFYKKGKKQKKEIQQLKTQIFAQIQNINQQNEDIQAIFIQENNVQTQENTNQTLEFEVENVQIKKADLEHLRNFNLAYKEQWGVFKESFLKIYPAFEHVLQEKVGALSNAELRLLMLHKLGLNNQEIAKTLLISPESVRTGKYRLYKKFGVSSNEELDKLL